MAHRFYRFYHTQGQDAGVVLALIIADIAFCVDLAALVDDPRVQVDRRDALGSHDLGSDGVLLLHRHVPLGLVRHERRRDSPDKRCLRLKFAQARNDLAELSLIRSQAFRGVNEVVEAAVEDNHVPLWHGTVGVSHENLQAIDHE